MKFIRDEINVFEPAIDFKRRWTAVRLRPLGVVHAQSFHYDENVRYMVGIYSLLTYEGGVIVPGDDMAGSEVRWFALDELQSGQLQLHVTAQPWMLARAVEVYRLWRNEDPPLQPEISKGVPDGQ